MKRSKILVADDDERNCRVIEAMLVPLQIEVILAKDGQEAIAKAKSDYPDVIMLDVMMPKLDGFEVAKRLKQQPRTSVIPIVMVTALKDVEDRVRALEAGADDFLSKPVQQIELKARVQSLLKVKAYNDQMAMHRQELQVRIAKRNTQLKSAQEKVRQASLDTIYRLARAAEYRDEDTGSHLTRISEYAAVVAQNMSLGTRFIEAVRNAAPMHDVGKIGIPDKILLKPGPLEEDEWKIMKQHTTIGADILKGSKAYFVRQGATIALTHHERWDGTGYPRGLKGKKIPLLGRIIAIADVFDALTTKRPYKEPYTTKEALDIILEGKGKSFDPDVFQAFLAGWDSLLKIKERYEDC